jgi:hypothetical protein
VATYRKTCPLDHGDAMSEGEAPLIVVANGHVIDIRVDRSGSPRSVIVSVELDYDQSWLFDEPGWQELAVGVSDGVAYWWSARHLVVLPTGQRRRDPLIICADEDIRVAFAVAEGWLLVCETSVRLYSDSHVVSRLDFGEVLLAARWEGSQLIVRDASSHDMKVILHEGRLATA